jgi:hypothetical protein
MNGAMRYVARGLLAAAALTGVWLVTPNKAQADSAGCTAVNGFITGFSQFNVVSVNTPSGTFAAGDTVTITLTLGAGFNPPFTTDFGIVPPGGGVPLSISGASNTTTVLVYTVPAAATGPFQINSSGPTLHTGTLSFSCSGSSSSDGPSRASAALQNAMNAQVAIANGQQVLQQTNDSIKLGVLSSFAAGSAPQMTQALAARAKAETLADQEAELARELADLSPVAGDDRRGALEQRLALTRRNLALVRGALAPAKAMSAPVDRALERLATGDEQKAAAPAAMRITGSQLADYCTVDCQAPDPSSTRWNGWLDGRLVGATDSVGPQSAFGFIGAAGVDYKVMPWMTIGLSVGTETFNNKFGIAGAYVSQTGISLAPYVGVRLDPNVFLSAFIGGTHLNYNSMPQPGQTAWFEAWRFMMGGSLTGVWRTGPWRLQPSVDIQYGSETQNAYTDSIGIQVPSQVVQYGRVRGGPEIGYRFESSDRGWSVEPFVLARVNIDLTSNNALLVNGQQVGLRGQASGGTGLGVVIHGHGFNIRADAAYDSIGISGLDIWTGRLRGGWSF